MKNGNGWIKWLVGVLFMIIFTAITTLATNVISNDKEARTRDEKIGVEIVKNQQEQQKTNQEMLVMLTEMKTDLKYIKKIQEKNERPNR